MPRTYENTSVRQEQDAPIAVYFVRHGHSAGPEISPALGPPLSKLGEYQAERIAVRLAKETFDHIYTSDLTRAHETSRIICSYHPSTPFTVTPDLREITHHNFIKPTAIPGSAVRKTMKAEMEAVRRFAERIRHDHRPGQKILVVAHGNLIRTIMPVLGGRNPHESLLIEFNNASLSILDVWDSGEAVLRLANCTRHLLPRQIT